MTRHAARTEGAPCRENQDRLAADGRTGTFLVADGIGGLADAASTAQAVADLLPSLLAPTPGTPPVSPTAPEAVAEVERVAASLVRTSEKIRAGARYGPGNAGAAVAVLVVGEGTAVTAHLGDSRVALLRHGRLSRLTVDHARPDGALTRFAGMPGRADPGVAQHTLRPTDLLLLSTDGLSVLDDDLVAGVLTRAGCLEEGCDELVRCARAHGSTDDVSVIVVAPAFGGTP